MMPNEACAEEKSSLTSLLDSRLSNIECSAVLIPDVLLFSLATSSKAIFLHNNLLKAQTEIYNCLRPYF